LLIRTEPRSCLVRLAVQGILLAVVGSGAAVAEPVAWTARVGGAGADSSLSKTIGSGWNAGAVSAKARAAAGSVSSTATPTNTNRACGLNHGHQGSTRHQIDFGISLSDVESLAAPLERTLHTLLGWEERLVRRVVLPVGGSVVARGRKPR
jgi:hypothetical protein